MRRVATMVIALMLITALLPSAAAAAPPSNDNFADAIVLSGTSGSVTGTNAEATLEPGEQFGSSNSMNYSVWYRWSPGRKDLVATFSTCGGAAWDTILQAYTSASTPATLATLEEVGFSDDGDADCNPQSSMTFLAKGGETYWIRLDGYFSYSNGPFTLTWSTAALVRATLNVTITNIRTDPNTCLFTVQGANLEPGQAVSVRRGDYYGPYLTTEGGRWTPQPVAYERSTWGVNAPGDIYLDYPVYGSDGVTPVTPKIVNRCK